VSYLEPAAAGRCWEFAAAPRPVSRARHCRRSGCPGLRAGLDGPSRGPASGRDRFV